MQSQIIDTTHRTPGQIGESNLRTAHVSSSRYLRVIEMHRPKARTPRLLTCPADRGVMGLHSAYGIELVQRFLRAFIRNLFPGCFRFRVSGASCRLLDYCVDLAADKNRHAG